MNENRISRKRRKLRDLLSNEIEEGMLPQLFDLLYKLRSEIKEEEKKEILRKIFNKVNTREVYTFARTQMESLGTDKKGFLCEILSEAASYVNPLSRETEEISILLGNSCSKVRQTIFRLNLKQNISKNRRAVSLQLITLIGRMLSAILEEVISGEIADGELATTVLEQKIGTDKNLKKQCKVLSDRLPLSLGSIYAAELFNQSLSKKEAFISKEFPNETLSLVSEKPEGLSSKAGAVILLYALLSSKNLDLEAFNSLLINNFNRGNFTPILTALIFLTVKTYSREDSRRVFDQIVYLRNNLTALFQFSGKEELMILESLEENDFKWVQALVWRRVFEAFIEEIRESSLIDFTRKLGDVITNNPLLIVKTLNTLTSSYLERDIIKQTLILLSKIVSEDNSEQICHEVAQVIRNLTFSASVRDLTQAITEVEGKRSIITLILKGSMEVTDEVLRLFKLSSTSWWLVEGVSSEKLEIKKKKRTRVEKKVRETLGEEADEVIALLIGE